MYMDSNFPLEVWVSVDTVGMERRMQKRETEKVEMKHLGIV